MDLIFAGYDLEVKKANHAFESALDMLAINTLDILNSRKNGVITESTSDSMIVTEASKFAQSVKDFFKKLLDTIRKTVHDIQIKISADIQARKINKTLTQLKRTMAVSRQLYSDEMIESVDMKALQKAYSAYCKFYVESIKQFLSKSFTSYDEYRNAYTAYTEKLNKKVEELKLNNGEAFLIKCNVNAAIKLTDEELHSYASIIRAISNETEQAVKGMMDAADNELKNAKEFASEKVSAIRTFATKLSNTMMSGLRKIVNAPMNRLRSIIGKTKVKDGMDDTGDDSNSDSSSDSGSTSD